MDKWMSICIIAVMGLLFGPIGCSEYQKYQCRIEAIKAGIDADKIGQACGFSK